MFSYGQRSKCADLLNSYKKSYKERTFCKIRIKNVESKKYAVQENEPMYSVFCWPRAQIWRFDLRYPAFSAADILNQLA